MPDRSALDWERALRGAYAAAFAVLRDAEHAKDVAQQACIKALMNLDSHSGSSFTGWVRVIAHNLAIDLRKKKRRLHELDPEGVEGGDDPERAAMFQQASHALHRCLSRLTEHQLMVFLAKYVDGMKGAEVASELDIAEGTVWAISSRVREILRGCLEKQGIRGTVH